MYQRNYEQFASTAKFWTECYAMELNPNQQTTNPAVQRLIEMGFEASAARKALLENKGINHIDIYHYHHYSHYSHYHHY
jgi:uncharacterized UBP type Zn finger protein